jgi:hypothetical protein
MPTARPAQRGFTQRETAMPILIIAILVLIALESFSKYTERTRAAELVKQYESLRDSANARARPAEDCAALAAGLEPPKPNRANAALGYGFVPASGGLRPVLEVCASHANAGEDGLRAARRAHDTLAGAGAVESGAVLTDKLVRFQLRLTGDKQALCQKPAAMPASCHHAAAGAAGPTAPAR